MRFLLFLFALAAFAQNAPRIGDWKPDTGESTVQPKGACAALHSLTGYELSVMTAESLHSPAGTEFCRVLLQAQPEIRIEVSLPANWNRRLYMFGNGGYAGESVEAPNRVAS